MGNAAYRRRLREQGIAALGGMCACCGESYIEFLTLDHVQNDAYRHRRNGKTDPNKAWREARDCGYDTSRFRVLCYNCNCARRHGPCPHERKKT